MLLLSVIIPTLDRPTKLSRCLLSVLKNDFGNFEIIVVDQSLHNITKRKVEKINSQKILYLHSKLHGKAKALNFAIRRAKGNIIALTDDDCIVSKEWLSEIVESFTKYKKISGVLGMVLPYKPELHYGEICPAITPNRKEFLVTKANYRFGHLGMGNNMAFRKDIFTNIGYFKEWLGVGSVGKSGIETEFIYRVLQNNNNISINPKAIVFHNRWLTRKQNQKKQIQYSCGFLAFCTYYLFRGHIGVLALMFEKIKRRAALRMKGLEWDEPLDAVAGIIEELIFVFKGLITGLYFSLFEFRSR